MNSIGGFYIFRLHYTYLLLIQKLTLIYFTLNRVDLDILQTEGNTNIFRVIKLSLYFIKFILIKISLHLILIQLYEGARDCGDR